jgi:probable DNA repair protein
MAADTAFQPESPNVPIQVLGVLESAGCEFDHLWVMGLSADAWPLAARPTPFLPVVLQRAAGIPEASAEASLELDRRITQGWLSAAGEVVVSHPSREADRELDPSPLVAAIPERALELPAYPSWRDVLYASRGVERLPDASAPAFAARESSGGSALIRDQAACPFRAFALHRLGSEGLEPPHAGLDALERGSLVHRVLAVAWEQLETKHALDSVSAADLRALLAKAAGDAVARQKRDRPTTLTGRFAEVEKRRLARLAFDWLQLERGRGDFSVFAIEAKRAIEVAGLRLNGRLDRVDETADGQRIVIDYKTRAPAAGAWLGERPDEPQLPLYLTAAEPGATAIAFAQVRARDMKFVALAAGKDILPGSRTLPDGRLKRAADSWDAQVAAWRDELGRLAGDFVAGKAEVDPKPGACEYCDQKPLCRIHEREGGLGDDSEVAA